VTLTDRTRVETIRWSWDARASLIEAHSHGDTGTACFSASDLWGLKEWVPHLRWRLRGCPYAAIVTAGETFDAIAWIDGSDQPEQIDHLEIVGEGRLAATARTLPSYDTLKEQWFGVR
jgi:hypothetical protein